MGILKVGIWIDVNIIRCLLFFICKIVNDLGYFLVCCIEFVVLDGLNDWIEFGVGFFNFIECLKIGVIFVKEVVIIVGEFDELVVVFDKFNYV